MKHETEEERWIYNCEDCVRTRECGEAEAEVIKSLGLQEVDAFQQELFHAVLQTMLRGVLVDKAARSAFAAELQEEMAKREQYFINVLGHPMNPRSSAQMINLFYNDLQQRPIMSRATKHSPSHLTCDDDALELLKVREPILRPLINNIGEYRSIGVFLSTFVLAPLDADGRMRCSFNICGTETYRFSSSKNAYGSGTNLQNIPKGVEAKEPDDLNLPNVRKIFIPDPGMCFFDMDLDRADLQVVVWEADDAELKAMLRAGVDIHTENAKTLGISRQLAKSWVHGTDYGGGPRTMAIACGITVHKAERMQRRWFEAHPGIKEWHTRVEDQLKRFHYVENKFGYRRFYFDRITGLLPEALGWIPQSTVACLINRIYLNIHKNLKEVWVLLQVHDSLAGQFPLAQREACLSRMKEEAHVVIPYSDPLIIPVGIKTSEKSWGDCV